MKYVSDLRLFEAEQGMKMKPMLKFVVTLIEDTLQLRTGDANDVTNSQKILKRHI